MQGGEAILRGQRNEFHLGRIVEDRGRDRAAIIDVETGPVALRVGQAEAGEIAVGAAIEHAAALDGLERLPHRGGGREAKRCGKGGEGK